ncbi:MAG TPA: aminopeptidase [Candidatus Paceibacterota bacterium]|nr:aminopeptidase [Candidatus Paceibacterota bacterium]
MGTDLRTQKLAKLIVNYSVFVKPGENVIISGGTEAEDFISALYKEVILAGGHPILKINIKGITPFFYKYAKKHQIDKFPEHFDYIVKNSQKYIGIDTEINTKDLTNCDSKKMVCRNKVIEPILSYIVNEREKIRRCTVGYPCIALAQEAEMDLVEYENFVYSSCLQNWNQLGKKIDKILNKFKKGKKVHLIGDGVDLKFNIHGDNACADDGKENMPGGEIFMAPVRESMNGWIKFDYPAIRDGKEVTDVFLRFENGKVIESKASKNEDFLKEMLSVDENASYVGEFGIGMNPKITKFTKSLLFDEKIGGTIHLALGMAYKENGGGNDSAIHWDIVKNMKKAKIILDDKIVQENGIWKI